MKNLFKNIFIEIITLEEDIECALLEKVEYEGITYDLANVLENGEFTDQYVIFKEIIEGKERYVEKVENITTLIELLRLFAVDAKWGYVKNFV